MTEQEEQQLRLQAEQAQRERDDAIAQRKSAEENFATEVRKISEWAQTLNAPVQQQSQRTPEEEELFVREQQFDQRINQNIARALTPIATTYLKDQLETNLRLADGDSPGEYWHRFKGEVAELLRKGIEANPALGTMQSIRQAYKLVLANHHDEILDEKLKHATRVQQQPGTYPEDADVVPTDDDTDTETETDETVERPRPTPTERPAAARSVAPMVAPSNARGPTATPTKKRVTLPANQAEAARFLGMSAAEHRTYNNQNYSADVLGIKGRRRV